MFNQLRKCGYHVQLLHHAEAILRHDMKEAAVDIESILCDLKIPIEEIIRSGGGEGPMTQRLRHAFEGHGWKKHSFEIKKIVDGVEKESISHQIDHVKHFKRGTFALEIEWNNKDPFFDRDLENFKRLHADGVISVGAIITRSQELQSNLREMIEDFAMRSNVTSFETLPEYCQRATLRQQDLYERAAKSKGSYASGWAHAFVSDKFGEATTHWRKLQDRVHRGVGNPCPLVLIGISKDAIVQE